MNNYAEHNGTNTSAKNSADVLLIYVAWNTSRVIFYVVTTTIALLVSTGVTANIIVCIVMARTQRIRKNLSNFFIFHLSLMDVVLRVLIFPILVLIKVPTTVKHTTATTCKSMNFIGAAWGSVVFSSMVIIAVDRYNNIVSPLKSLKRKSNPFYILTALWLYAIVFSAPFLFSAASINIAELPEIKDHLAKLPDSNQAMVCDLVRDWRGRFSTTIYFVFSFFLPLLVISAAYTKIVMCLWRRGQRHQMNHTATRSKVKAVRMLILMVLGFVLCWGPTTLLSMLRSYHLLDQQPFVVVFVVTMIAEVLMYASSVVNPVLYAYYNGDFRKQLIHSCCKHACCVAKVAQSTAAESSSRKLVTTLTKELKTCPDRSNLYCAPSSECSFNSTKL